MGTIRAFIRSLGLDLPRSTGAFPSDLGVQALGFIRDSVSVRRSVGSPKGSGGSRPPITIRGNTIT